MTHLGQRVVKLCLTSSSAKRHPSHVRWDRGFEIGDWRCRAAQTASVVRKFIRFTIRVGTQNCETLNLLRRSEMIGFSAFKKTAAIVGAAAATVVLVGAGA